jgi:hypothetical protein
VCQFLTGAIALFGNGLLQVIALPTFLAIAAYLSVRAPARAMLAASGITLLVELALPSLDNPRTTGLGTVRFLFLLLMAVGTVAALRLLRLNKQNQSITEDRPGSA